MKVLLVFVSALELVAHGSVIAAEEDGVHAVVAGQEADGEARQEYREEAPVVALFGGEEESRVNESVDSADEQASESGVYIPSVARVCTNAACASVCHRLGFKYGQCISLDTCWCYN